MKKYFFIMKTLHLHTAIFYVFNHFDQTVAYKNAFQPFLLEDPESKLKPTKEKVKEEKLPKIRKPFFRVIGEEVMGNRRAPGKGEKDTQKAKVSPEMCGHPRNKLETRGNRSDKWWICKDCLARSDRLPLSNFESKSVTPDHKDLLMFGKHCGEMFKVIYDKDQDYCKWVKETVTKSYENTYSPHMQRFAYYLQLMDAADPLLMAAEVPIYEGHTSDSDLEEVENATVERKQEPSDFEEDSKGRGSGRKLGLIIF